MVLDYFNPKGGKMFAAPGTILSLRKDALIKYGGFHRSADNCHLYGLVPFGITGFDEEAFFYWRRHEGQLNKALFQRGWTGVKENYSMLNDFNIRERWSSSFGENVARYVVSRISSIYAENGAKCTVICFFTLNFKGAIRSLSDSFWRFAYWKALPELIWRYKMTLVLSLLSRFQWVIQPLTNVLSNLLPSNTPELGVIKKIQRYYDEEGVPTTMIPNKKPSHK